LGGTWHDTDWKVGSRWEMKFADGRTCDAGEILEADRPKRLVIKWRNAFMPEFKAEGFARCTFEIEPTGELVKLTVVHEMDVPDSKLIASVSQGWPKVLSSMKSLLETGKPLEELRNPK